MQVTYADDKFTAAAERLKVQRAVEAEAAALKNRQNTAILKSKIESGEISTRIQPQVQARHIEGTAQFEDYKARRPPKGKRRRVF